MRIVRFVCGLGLLAGAFVYQLDGAAAQGGPDARQACAPEAIRLCSEFIPDVPKITACMKRRHRELSKECAIAMGGGRHEARRRHRAVRVRAHCDKNTHLCS